MLARMQTHAHASPLVPRDFFRPISPDSDETRRPFHRSTPFPQTFPSLSQTLCAGDPARLQQAERKSVNCLFDKIDKKGFSKEEKEIFRRGGRRRWLNFLYSVDSRLFNYLNKRCGVTFVTRQMRETVTRDAGQLSIPFVRPQRRLPIMIQPIAR